MRRGTATAAGSGREYRLIRHNPNKADTDGTVTQIAQQGTKTKGKCAAVLE